MRKFLMGLTILAGVAAVPAAQAASRAVPSPLAFDAPIVQPAQYYGDWRYREWRRHEAFERYRRHQWRRQHRFEEREYGRRGW